VVSTCSTSDGRAAPQQPGVGAGHADRRRAGGLHQPDELGVDLPEQAHADDVHHRGAGDAQPAHELAGDTELVGEGGDLRPAAVDDDRSQAHEVQQGHVGGEGALELLVDHRVAAVLDDDRLAVEPGDPRQRLAQHRGLVLGGGGARVVGGHGHGGPQVV
jgi:hypothetical protein